MKKIVLSLAVVAFAAVSFTSCKKDYTCSCSDPTGDTQKIEIKDAKKADAEDACAASNTIWALVGGSCKLD
jgi:hypothetical protein